MQIESEKKYILTNDDYQIIKKECVFIKKVNLKDYYLDKDMILTKNDYLLRIRNGQYELKIIDFDPETKIVNSEEYEDEYIINEKIKQFNITIDDATGTIFIDTNRKKYSYNFEGYDINIDVEEYQYGTRYEVEIITQANDNTNKETIKKELNIVIENFRKKLGLIAESNVSTSKVITCAMHQNIEMYEILTKNTIEINNK